MPPKRRKFQRPSGERRYRKLFVVAVEGNKTEPQYFAILNNQKSLVWVKCIKGSHGNSPPQVLKRMKNYLRQENLRSSDEAWLVVDKDQWTDEQLVQLHAWAQTNDNYGFAVSNPSFEYWLLLHFEDGTGMVSARDCNSRLKQYLPGYNKSIASCKIAREQINKAIGRARLRDNPPCPDWPRVPGGTTVYKLVENILQT